MWRTLHSLTCAKTVPKVSRIGTRANNWRIELLRHRSEHSKGEMGAGESGARTLVLTFCEGLGADILAASISNEGRQHLTMRILSTQPKAAQTAWPQQGLAARVQ